MTTTTPKNHPLPFGLSILFEDSELLVINKPGGLLSMGTAVETERTAYSAMMDWVRKGDPKSRKRVFIVHRLDRETSGVLVLAKTEKVKRTLQDNWEEVKKTYLAVVEGHPAADSGLQQSYLAETDGMRVYSTPNASQGSLAKTQWRVLRRTPRLSLLEIDLLTGRKHQIRVHMAEMGHPVVGDTKYGRHTGKDPLAAKEAMKPGAHRTPLLALHSRRVELVHPMSGKPMVFEAPLPRSIAGLIGGLTETLQPLEAKAGAQEPKTASNRVLLTVSVRGKVVRRSKEIPLKHVLCRLLYPQGIYQNHITKEPYTGPWPEGFDPANPPQPPDWTMPWPPPGEEGEP